ncbi:MAG: hypothetical protein Q9217_003038 [Psora testacea]
MHMKVLLEGYTPEMMARMRAPRTSAEASDRSSNSWEGKPLKGTLRPEVAYDAFIEANDGNNGVQISAATSVRREIRDPHTMSWEQYRGQPAAAYTYFPGYASMDEARIAEERALNAFACSQHETFGVPQSQLRTPTCDKRRIEAAEAEYFALVKRDPILVQKQVELRKKMGIFPDKASAKWV